MNRWLSGACVWVAALSVTAAQESAQQRVVATAQEIAVVKAEWGLERNEQLQALARLRRRDPVFYRQVKLLAIRDAGDIPDLIQHQVEYCERLDEATPAQRALILSQEASERTIRDILENRGEKKEEELRRILSPALVEWFAVRQRLLRLEIDLTVESARDVQRELARFEGASARPRETALEEIIGEGFDDLQESIEDASETDEVDHLREGFVQALLAAKDATAERLALRWRLTQDPDNDDRSEDDERAEEAAEEKLDRYLRRCRRRDPTLDARALALSDVESRLESVRRECLRFIAPYAKEGRREDEVRLRLPRAKKAALDEILNRLAAARQAAIRAELRTLRDEIKGMEDTHRRKGKQRGLIIEVKLDELLHDGDTFEW